MGDAVKRVFVFFSYGHEIVRLQAFADRAEALAFINRESSRPAYEDQFTVLGVVEGVELELNRVEVALSTLFLTP